MNFLRRAKDWLADKWLPIFIGLVAGWAVVFFVKALL